MMKIGLIELAVWVFECQPLDYIIVFYDYATFEQGSRSRIVHSTDICTHRALFGCRRPGRRRPRPLESNLSARRRPRARPRAILPPARNRGPVPLPHRAPPASDPPSRKPPSQFATRQPPRPPPRARHGVSHRDATSEHAERRRRRLPHRRRSRSASRR